ncbi:hypothetical protein [Streptomyces sp. NPDC003710]
MTEFAGVGVTVAVVTQAAVVLVTAVMEPVTVRIGATVVMYAVEVVAFASAVRTGWARCPAKWPQSWSRRR